MEVAILYSGGKDSSLAIEYCMNKRWKIKYLLSIKPTRKDCYLFHYATVELTRELASILGLRHIYLTCDVADPQKEADIVRKVVEENMVDAVVLGGTGLQETQIKSIRDAVFDLGVEVFATHTNQDHGQVMYDMISRGYDIRITQVAAEGLDRTWLGRKLTESSFRELKRLSEKHGFHLGFEGGHADTLVIDGPIFPKRLEILESVPVMEDECTGHLMINKISIIDKRIALKDLY